MKILNIKNIFYDKILSEIKKSFVGNKSNKRFIRVEVELEAADLVSWIEKQKEFSKLFYWNDVQAGLETAGIGIADVISDDDTNNLSEIIINLTKTLYLSPSGIRYFGSLNFSKAMCADSDWRSFGTVRFLVPRFELIKSRKKTVLCCNYLHYPDLNSNPSLDILKTDIEKLSLDFSDNSKLYSFPNIVSDYSIPQKGEWDGIFEKISDQINSGAIKKIVLAKRKSMLFADKINAWELVRRLKKNNPKTIIFGIQSDESSFFVGATPEYLYQRKNDEIQSQAIAGTRKRDRNIARDSELEKELLCSEKELNEHKFVLNYFKNSFNKLCSDFICAKTPSVLKYSTLQHLFCELKGILKSNINDYDILNELHPSPAVGGTPKLAALKLINDNEQFERGLYSAPIGWFGVDAAKFAVGIRSALVKDNLLSIYAGAGIVKESNSDYEWQEIEDKLENFTRILKN